MSDLISRQEAIEALGERPIVWTDDDQYTLGERYQYDIDRLAIETLPSVQPNLQNQLATDCISRQDMLDALKAIPDHNDGMVFETLSHALRDIELLPSTQPERKVGKWNWDFADNGWADWTCSICGWKKNTDIHVNLGYNYCPNCGARMKEVTE